MKKSVKIIVPILLALAILGASIWYLFVYDQGFTRDVLLSGARRMEAAGNHEFAAWLYSCAYAQAGGSDQIAIELAQQYCSIGNYTKAEYTLTGAIADGGGRDLYIALSRTYVEQDKLLDAVTFLNHVTDPEVKAELDKMRPAVPEVDLEPGFYNQYISVSVTGKGGTLYATDTGAYPSVKDDPCEAPFSLQGGETTVQALVVAENGLVSPLGIFGYTIGGVVEDIAFADPVMEATLRSLAGVPADRVARTDDLWSIKKFEVPEGVNDLSDLKYLLFLQELTVSGSTGNGLNSLGELIQLEKLTVTNTPVFAEVIPGIGNLPKLKELTLQSCGLSTIAGLEHATHIQTLDLSDNTVRDIQPLSAMKDLQTAKLQHNAIVSVEALAGNTALTTLDLSYNSIGSAAPLKGLRQMNWLAISNNQLADLSGVEKMTSLTYLDASANVLTGISSLASCSSLTGLNLSNNQLQAVAETTSLTKLETLDISYNQIAALPAYGKNCALVSVNGSYNQITSLESLRGLQALNKVNMDYNPNLSDITPLADCPVLILVNVYGTQVTRVSKLTDMSVVVNYNPT